jgi:NitT/TauT family transport system permease protein
MVKVPPILLNLLGPVGILVLWETIAVSGLTSTLLLPPPTDVIAVFLDPDKLSSLMYDAALTATRALSGFILGAFVGLIFGLVIGLSKTVYSSMEFLIEFFRSLPAAALLPPFMLFFGIGNLSKILLVAFSCSLVVIVNTAAGVKQRNPTRTMIAQILGANRRQAFLKIVLPEVLPAVATALRISISLALIVTVVAEMLVSSDVGLGRTILDTQLLFKTAEMYAAILLTGIIGYAANKGISIAAERFIHWEGK